MKINRKNGLRKMQVTDVIIPLLKGGWYHRVSPVKEKPHVLRGDIYLFILESRTRTGKHISKQRKKCEKRQCFDDG